MKKKKKGNKYWGYSQGQDCFGKDYFERICTQCLCSRKISKEEFEKRTK